MNTLQIGLVDLGSKHNSNSDNLFDCLIERSYEGRPYFSHI